MTHFRTPQGQFRKPTPSEKVSAHVERVNALAELAQARAKFIEERHNPAEPIFAKEGFLNWSDPNDPTSFNPNWKDQAANEAFADLKTYQERLDEARASDPVPDWAVPAQPRAQPIEYDDDREVWPWVLACGFVVFILVTAIWVLTH